MFPNIRSTPPPKHFLYAPPVVQTSTGDDNLPDFENSRIPMGITPALLNGLLQLPPPALWSSCCWVSKPYHPRVRQVISNLRPDTGHLKQ